ncbi:MAG: hypothetical protein J1F40_04875, partial [Prevotellaceae bacterium]|nr:hypothetical protein [Prevotellaceae bacterium]
MKRKLLFVAAVVASALGFHANAQKDVTETYLVNPSFETLKAADGETEVAPKANLENGLYGWEIVANAPLSNYCVESEASGSTSGFVATDGGSIIPSDGTYYYFNRQGWGSPSTELKTTTKTEVEPGKYYLVFDYKAADYSNNNNTGNNGTTIGVTVKGASDDVIATVDAIRRSYSMANNGSNPQNNPYMQTAPWTQLGVYFEVEEASVLTFAIQQNMKNSGRSDIAYDNFRLYQIDGKADLDMTGVIANPSFEAGHILNAGWTTSNKDNETGAKPNNGSQYTITNADGNYIFNTWTSGGTAYSLSQTISNIPAGKYKLSAVVASGADDASQDYTIVLSAGETSENVIVRDKTIGVTGEVEFEHAGGNLEIKVSSEKWFKADNFKLTLLAEPIVGEFKGAGIYYIYNEETGKFFSRGSWWGTRAVADEYGLPIKVSLDGEGLYNLAALDNSEAYYGQDYWMYSDKAKNEGDYRTYRINEVEGMEGTYTITVTSLNMDVYINLDEYGLANNAILDGDEKNCESVAYTYWKFLTKEQHDAILEEKAAAAAQTVAGKAGLESLEGLEPVGKTVELSFVQGKTNWTGEPTSDRGANVDPGTYGTEVYQGTVKFTQSVSDLEEGLYLVTIKGFLRDGWNDDVSATYTDGYDCVLAYLDANGATVRVANWAEHAAKNNNTWAPDNKADAEKIFGEEGKYIKSVITYVGKSGKLDLTVVSPSYLGGCWLMLNNVTYTKIEEPAEVVPVETDLTDDMYHAWTASDADATISGTPWGAEFNIGTETSNVIYGHGSVPANDYAALAEYDALVITMAEGSIGVPRFLFGRSTDGSNDFIEINSADSKYVTASEDGLTWTIDLNMIKAEKDGLANLNVIKAQGGAVTVTSIKLVKNEKAITFNVTEAGYATYVTPAALEFGEDEAFVVRKVQIGDDESVAILDNVTAAPAGTPVIIKGAGKHTFATATTEPDAIEGSLLHVAEGTESEGVYVLANLEERVGFYALDGVTLRKGIVYLEDEEAEEAGIKFIGFDGNGATAIKDVDVPTVENGIFYNLAGQRVQNPTKGIYIVNGKKVLVK